MNPTFDCMWSHAFRLVRTHATYQVHRCRDCGKTDKRMT